MSGTTSPILQQEFLRETVALTLDFLSDILIDLKNVEDFSPEREYFWNSKIAKLTSDLSQFVELTTLLGKLIQARMGVTLPEIKKSHIHLLFILKAMNQARIKIDTIALEDLIKYELKDNLTQWKIDLIPLIKKILNT